jgi:hypothetical protein
MYGGKKPDPDFAGKYDIEKIRMTGFIAQEVDRAAQASGFDFSGVVKPANGGDLYSLRYSEFVVPLVKSVQELTKMLDEKQKTSDEQQAVIIKLREQNDEQQTINLKLQQQMDEVKRKIEELMQK